MRAWVVLLGIAMAGCSSPTLEVVETPTEATRVPFSFQDSSPLVIDAAIGTPMGGGAGAYQERSARFTVPAGTQNLGLGAQWTCASADCRLQFYVEDPRGAQVVSADAASPASFHIPDPAPGAWLIYVYAEVAGADYEGEFVSRGDGWT